MIGTIYPLFLKIENRVQLITSHVLTPEQKRKKEEDLKILIEKYQKLTEALRNLQSFRLTTDGMSIQVRLYDHSTAQEFKTSHSVVIQIVITTCNGYWKRRSAK